MVPFALTLIGPSGALTTTFCKFWDPFLSLEWVKPDASNLVHRLTVAITSQLVVNYPQMGHFRGSRDIQFKVWDLWDLF